MPVTLQLESMINYARQLQTASPRWSNTQVIARIRERLELGYFGRELCALVHPSSASTRPSVGQPANFFVPVAQPAGNGYPTFSQSSSYSQHGMPQFFCNTNTINLSSLEGGYTYTAHLNEDGDSDIAHTEGEFGTSYNHVSVLGVTPDLIVQDTHDASVTGSYPWAHGFESREGFSSFGIYSN